MNDIAEPINLPPLVYRRAVSPLLLWNPRNWNSSFQLVNRSCYNYNSLVVLLSAGLPFYCNVNLFRNETSWNYWLTIKLTSVKVKDWFIYLTLPWRSNLGQFLFYFIRKFFQVVAVFLLSYGFIIWWLEFRVFLLLDWLPC